MTVEAAALKDCYAEVRFDRTATVLLSGPGYRVLDAEDGAGRPRRRRIHSA